MMRRTLGRRCAVAAPASAAWPRGDDRPNKAELFPLHSTHHGFTVTAVTPIPDLRMTVFKFTHDATGADVHHIDSNDKNNAFCIGFGTPATSSRGTTHVLEHTVLCGSEKYPIKDPFFNMLRRSLSTFMNAMTGADYTLYPFSTMHCNDYSNLLGVYLDATFNPLLREDDFRQEAHRIEPVTAASTEGAAEATDGAEAEKSADDGAALKYNGVVYNEMKGVISEPGRYFMQSLQRHMLPGTHYEHLSGGDPPEVLELTHREVVEYHRTHYSPENSVTLTYGDMDPRPTLEALNAQFGAFTARHGRQQRVDVPRLQQWRTEPTDVSLRGPANVMGDPSKQQRVTVAYAMPPSDANAERLTFHDIVHLSVLDQLLTDGPSSPMYRALIAEGQFGSGFAPLTGFMHHYSTPLMCFGVEDVDETANKAREIESTVVKTLAETVEGGFDPRRVASTVFQTELSQRHRGATYGVYACIGLAAFNITMNANPADYLNWLPHLTGIQQSPEQLQATLKKVTLENAHRGTLTVTADPKHSAALEAALDDKSKAMNAAHDSAARAEVAASHEAWSERMKKEHDTSVLPSLTVRDISSKCMSEPARHRAAAGIDVIKTDANGLVYVNGIIPCPDLLHRSEDQLLRLPATQSLMKSLGVQGLNFMEFDVEWQLLTAGYSISTTSSNYFRDPSQYILGTSFGFYTTAAKVRPALDLLRRVFMEPRTLDDADRTQLATMLCNRAARSAQGLQHRGNQVAAIESYKHLSEGTAAAASFSGLAQARFLEKLQARLVSPDDRAEAIADVESWRAAHLQDVASRANAHGIDMWAICDAENEADLVAALRDFRRDVSASTAAENDKPLMTTVSQDFAGGITAAAKATPDDVTSIELPINTNFVGYTLPNTLKRTDDDQIAVRLATQILKSEFLHQEVRERGGAYGAGCSPLLGSVAGGVVMSSYRDPNPKNTLRVFGSAGEWLATPGSITQERVDQAKLQIFSNIDAPVTCDQYGAQWHMSAMSEEDEQAMRDRLLAVTVDDVVKRAPQYFDAARRGELKPSRAVLVPSAAAAAEADASAEE